MHSWHMKTSLFKVTRKITVVYQLSASCKECYSVCNPVGVITSSFTRKLRRCHCCSFAAYTRKRALHHGAHFRVVRVGVLEKRACMSVCVRRFTSQVLFQVTGRTNRKLFQTSCFTSLCLQSWSTTQTYRGSSSTTALN
jgi:hypothetical protein